MQARILVVDDELHQRRSLALGLCAYGFSVVEACDGVDALRVLEHDQVDLVITDMMMPNMNGVSLCRFLQVKRPELPVVLASGYELGLPQIERAGLRVLAFVAKPYHLEELALFLQMKLSQRATSVAPPT